MALYYNPRSSVMNVFRPDRHAQMVLPWDRRESEDHAKLIETGFLVEGDHYAQFVEFGILAPFPVTTAPVVAQAPVVSTDKPPEVVVPDPVPVVPAIIVDPADDGDADVEVVVEPADLPAQPPARLPPGMDPADASRPRPRGRR